MPRRVEEVRLRKECAREGVSEDAASAGPKRGDGGSFEGELCSNGLRGIGR